MTKPSRKRTAFTARTIEVREDVHELLKEVAQLRGTSLIKSNEDILTKGIADFHEKFNER